jgi:hemolysin III
MAAVGTLWLLWLTRQSTAQMLTMAIYGLSLVTLFSASSALHLVKASPSTIQFLRRLDHAAIYLLIAGTYTPITYHVFSGGWRWGILSIIWAMAVAGVVFKLSFLNESGRVSGGHWSTLGYVAMGWVGVIAIPELINMMPLGAAVLIIGGGLFYSIGAIIFALEKPNFHAQFGFHEIWHIFVLIGSGFHFFAVAIYMV